MADTKPIILSGGKLKQVGSTDTIPTNNLGTGTANATTYLRGDQTWAAPPGGSVSLPIVTTDPVAPANGDAWLYKKFAAGEAMGALGMTYNGFYQLSTKTSDGIRRINLID